MNRKRPEPIDLPLEKKPTYILTNSGRFTEGDLTISRDGLLIGGVDSPHSLSFTQPASTSRSTITAAGEDESCSSMGSMETGEPCDLSLEDLQEVGVVGSGSSGIAKKVVNRNTGQILVLKVISFDVNSDTIRKQVTQEVRTLHGACHRHVVRYHQAFFHNGAVTIVMEYMDAGSLADVLKQVKRLPECYLAEVARSVVSGLMYLHKDLHVVHRDIKPSNLLLNTAGECKISDFGVSGQLANSVSACMSWVGTITYMSPERIKGEAYSYGSDIWSLGLTLLECVTGRYPYPTQLEGGAQVSLGFWELLEYIVVEPPPLLSREQYSPELVDFLSKCLQKDARHRPSIVDLSKHSFLRMYSGTNLADLARRPI